MFASNCAEITAATGFCYIEFDRSWSYYCSYSGNSRCNWFGGKVTAFEK